MILMLIFLGGCTTFNEKNQPSDRGEPSSQSGVSGKITASKEGRYNNEKIQKSATRKCPICGRKYSLSMEYCPYDGTELK